MNVGNQVFGLSQGLAKDGMSIVVKTALGLYRYQCKPADKGIVWIYTNNQEKIGLATVDGELLIEPTYGEVESFINGYAKVSAGSWYYEDDEEISWRQVRKLSGGKWGVINNLGRIVVPTTYDSIQIEDDCTFSVTRKIGWHQVSGLLNNEGELIIKKENGEYIPALKKYDWQEDFNNKGRSRVYYKGNIGYVNTKLQLIVHPHNDDECIKIIPEEFEWGYYCTEDTFIGVKSGERGVFTYDGEEVFLANNKLIQHIGYGLYSVQECDKKFYIINEKGIRTNDISFDKVYIFGEPNKETYSMNSHSIIDDALYTIVMKDNLYGTINRLGKIVIPMQYRALCCHNRNVFYGDYNYIDALGHIVAVSGDKIVKLSKEYSSAVIVDNELILVEEKKLYGCINKKGDIIIPIKYNKLTYTNNLFVAKKKNEDTGKIEMGVVNILHKEIVPFSDSYSDIKIENGLIMYRIDKYWGAFTLYGKLICEPKYSHIKQITEYIIKVGIDEFYFGCRDSKTHWGLINIDGEEILSIDRYNEPKRTISDYLFDGFIVYYDTYDRVGYLDATGREIIKPNYTHIGKFSDGYAIVAKTSYYSDKKEYLYGVIDSSFKEIIPCAFRSIEYERESGLFKTNVGYKALDGRYIAEVNGDKLFIDAKYDYCEEFHNGYAIAVKTTNLDLEEISYGLIDIDSRDILPPVYQHIRLLDNGLYKLKKDSLYGLADSAGNIIVPNKFHVIGKFNSNLAITLKKIGENRCGENIYLYGYINNNGAEVLPSEYEYMGKCSEGKVVLMKNNVWALFDTTTLQIQIIVGINYLGIYQEGLCRYNVGGTFNISTTKIDGGLWGYMDNNGKIVITPQYELARSFSEGIAAVKKDGKWGFIDKDNAIIVPCEYDEVTANYTDGKGELKKENTIYLFDNKGNLINNYEEEADYHEYNGYDDVSVYDNPYYNDNLDMDQ